MLPALPASSELVSGRSPRSRGGGNRTRPFLTILSPRAPKNSRVVFSGHGLVVRLCKTEPCKKEKEPLAAAEPPSSAAADSAAPVRKGNTRHRGAAPEAVSHGS